MANRYCPDCNSALLPGKCSCGCGWKFAAAPKQETVDYRCAFSSGNSRCPATGTISPNIRGGGPWYCRWHFKAQGDPSMGLRILDEFDRDGIPRQQDWRDEMIEQDMYSRPAA